MERSVAALNRIRSILLAAMALFCVLTLSGCIAKTVDELYALPRHSDEYYELQKAIDGVMTEGVQYAAPVSGRNQQSVQLADLDGDGEDEAVVFLRTTGENPLSACIFDLHHDLEGIFRNDLQMLGSNLIDCLNGCLKILRHQNVAIIFQ